MGDEGAPALHVSPRRSGTPHHLADGLVTGADKPAPGEGTEDSSSSARPGGPAGTGAAGRLPGAYLAGVLGPSGPSGPGSQALQPPHQHLDLGVDRRTPADLGVEDGPLGGGRRARWRSARLSGARPAECGGDLPVRAGSTSSSHIHTCEQTDPLVGRPPSGVSALFEQTDPLVAWRRSTPPTSTSPSRFYAVTCRISGTFPVTLARVALQAGAMTPGPACWRGDGA